MSDKLEHAVFGAISACLVNGYNAKLNGVQMTPQEALGSALTGAIFSLVPDALEPSDNPNHRDSGHSIAALLLLLSAGKTAMENQGMPANKKTLLLSALAGYSSHLIMDSTTPAGLPIIQNEE